MNQDKDQLEPGGEQQNVAADATAETVQQAGEPSQEGEEVLGAEVDTDDDGA